MFKDISHKLVDSDEAHPPSRDKWRKNYNNQIVLQFWQIKQGLTANLI